LLFVGLTGGIGSGKSEALAACERLGAAVLSSDQVVHELLSTDEVRELLAARWGSKVAANDGVSREAVAEIVFERPEELAWLESVLFPRVGERMAAWRAELERQAERTEVGVVEVPLLFEAGVEAAFDATVAVISEEGLRQERAATRDHRALGGRQARQLSQDEKASRADYVVRNDGTLAELEQAMKKVLDEIRNDIKSSQGRAE
jgi:dephospho-CoA kinase